MAQRAPEPIWAQKPTINTQLAVKEAHSKYGQNYMAVTANPDATKVAAEILKRNGSAADAAIAAQLVLGLVEPQSSGLGGGAFALYWSQQQRHLHSYDGRETAPQAITANHFYHDDQNIMSFFEAVVGGHSVGVPGVVALLVALHEEHGKLPWATLFKPAIQLARDGFKVSPRLHTLLQFVPQVATHPHSRDYFFKDNKPLPIGTVLKNPEYATTLEKISATKGVDFYSGAIAQRIVQAVRNDPIRTGLLSSADMANYTINKNQALCSGYQQYIICGAPPPSSGGSSVLAILNLLSHRDTTDLATFSSQRIHLFAEASKIAFADRNTWLAEADIMPIAVTQLLNPNYLQQRAHSINLNHASSIAQSGSFTTPKPAPDQGKRPPSTSHFSMVDRWGNVLSMTSSIETAFGSRIMVGGFLLNNQLSDFSFSATDKNGQAVLNRPRANAKPRSSMAPTIVFNEYMQPRLVLGSPGGARIIDYVAQTIWWYLDTPLDLDDAIEMGRIVHTNKQTLELEQGRYTQSLHKKLTALGHNVKAKRHGSGISAIAIEEDGRLFGVADPRREGTAEGD